jgi:hypothetical protein
MAALTAAAISGLGMMAAPAARATGTAPASTAPASTAAAVSTGAPVIYDGTRDAMEVYAIDSSGALEQNAFTPGTSWRGWESLGGSFTGTPSAVWDSYTGAIDVFAIAAGTGALEENAYANGAWIGWRDLGGDLAGTPAAYVDPVTHHVDVFGVAPGGALEEDAWTGSWQGWQSLGGDVTGTPAPSYDSVTGNLEVYVIDSDQALEEDAYTNGAWNGLRAISGYVYEGLTGSPSVVSDPGQDAEFVWALAGNGILTRFEWTPEGGWNGGQALSTTGPYTGSPTAILDPYTGNIEIYATSATTGTLSEEALTGPDDLLADRSDIGGDTPAADPVAVNDPVLGGPDVYALDGTTLSKTTWTASGSWTIWEPVGTGITAP